MKFVLSCLIVLQLVACSSSSLNNHINPVRNAVIAYDNSGKNTVSRQYSTWSRKSTAPIPVIPPKYKNECSSLRVKFNAANQEVRELGKEWRTVPGSERLSGRGRAMFSRNYKASHKFTNIQHKSLKQMKANEKAILSQLPSYDASVCDTKDMSVMSFPPMTGTVL